MMDINLVLAFAAVYLLVLCAIAYAVLCGNANSKSWMGQCSRFITRTLPNTAKDIFRRLVGEKVLNYFLSWIDYFVNKRNPALIIAYVVIINGAFVGWLIDGAPLLPTSLVSDRHFYISIFGVFAAQLSFYYAMTTSPGIITDWTIPQFNHQPFDGVIYASGSFCKTCKIPKLARSKHCSLCGFCVPIFDHHCIWLNQCVGEQNHRYFLTFLIVNSCFFIYGAYITSLLLVSEAYERNLLNAVFYNHVTGEEFAADYFIVLQYILGRHPMLFAVWLIALAMGIAVSAFLSYHLYLLAVGTTTNESFKWDYVKKVHKELVKSFTSYRIALKYGRVKPKQPTPQTESNASTVTSTKKEDNKGLQTTFQQRMRDVQNGSDQFVGCMPSGFTFNEPPGYKKQLVRDVIERLDDESEAAALPDMLDEDPGDLPKNIYRLGLLRDLWSASVFPTKFE